MDANSTGLRGLLDVVKSNRLMSTGVIGFLLLMAVMAVIDGGISMMPLILATCAVGTAAVFFWQAGSYRVDIYENGLEIFGGVLTRAGVYLYKDIESIDIEDTTYRLFGVFPVLKYTTVSIQGKNDLWTQLSSFNFTDLKVKMQQVKKTVGKVKNIHKIPKIYAGIDCIAVFRCHLHKRIFYDSGSVESHAQFKEKYVQSLMAAEKIAVSAACRMPALVLYKGIVSPQIH